MDSQTINKTATQPVDPSIRTAQPLDALGLVTLLASVYFFQIWGLTVPNSPMPAVLHYLLMALSGVGVLLPRLRFVLVFNAIAFAIFYFISSPVASNNQTTAFFFSVIVVGALASNSSADRDDLFANIARAGRWILPSMYFFGIYHKINTDFLDPVVSCAVVLYEALFNGSVISNWGFGHYGAIYATFVIEGIAMVALFIPKLKVYGMLIGIPFHLIIGFTGYAYYKDFSTIVLVLYALFIPKEAYAKGLNVVKVWVGNEAKALRAGRIVIICFALLYVFFGALRSTPSLIPTHATMVPFFAFYGICFYLFATLYTPRRGGTAFVGGVKWLMVVPVLYFANGWSPYLGLKTESSIAMFSNLHTEGQETNHLLHGVLPGMWSYQDNLITPLSSNMPAFDRVFVGEGRALVRYEFDKLLAELPELQVTIQSETGPQTVGADWNNTYLETHPLLRKFLIFKPVDFNRPKVCTH